MGPGTRLDSHFDKRQTTNVLLRLRTNAHCEQRNKQIGHLQKLAHKIGIVRKSLRKRASSATPWQTVTNFGNLFKTVANRCRPLRTIASLANRSTPLQADANRYKPLQALQTVTNRYKNYKPLQTVANSCKPLQVVANHYKPLPIITNY